MASSRASCAGGRLPRVATAAAEPTLRGANSHIAATSAPQQAGLTNRPAYSSMINAPPPRSLPSQMPIPPRTTCFLQPLMCNAPIHTPASPAPLVHPDNVHTQLPQLSCCCWRTQRNWTPSADQVVVCPAALCWTAATAAAAAASSHPGWVIRG